MLLLIIKNLSAITSKTEDLNIPMSSDQYDFLAKDTLVPGLVPPTKQTQMFY